MSLFNETTESTETNEVVETQETQAVASESPETSAVVAETPTGETSSEATEAPAAEVDPREAVNQVAEQYGYSPEALAGFESAEAATAAIKYRADQLAKAGLSGANTQATAPSAPPAQSPGTPEPVPTDGLIDLAALGLEEDDPAAKAIRALEAGVNAQAQQSAQFANMFAQQRQEAQQRQQVGLHQQADAVVSEFQSPTFGSSGNRTSAQEWNVQRLYDLADALAIGSYNQGQPIQPIGQRLQQARLLFDDGSVPKGTSTEQKKADALPVNQQTLREEVPGMKMTTKWSDNPELLAAIRG